MKLKIRSIALISILLASTNLVGCMPISMGIIEKHSDIEKVALTVLDSNELISIKETELDEKTKKNKTKKDLCITLNLAHSVESVALDNALLKSTRVINVLEETFEEKINDYKFIVNTTKFDVYGNEQKIKILEISVDNDEVEKIKFENFDYKNLEKISDIKKFNYLKDDDSSNNKSDLDSNKNDSEKSSEEKAKVD